MYPVSNAFLTAMQSPTQRHILSGTIGSGSEVSFTQENILAGSFSITNQCSDSSEITLGSVYIGELNATFIGLDIPRYSWYGMDITVYFGVEIEDEEIEYIPMGVFTVAEADWTQSGTVVRAYDYMSKLDGKYDGTQVTGAPWTIIQYICHACSIDCVNTQAQIEAMANGTELITLYEENDVETWRDVVSWLAVTLGAFATMDRTGKLLFKQYTQTVVDTVTDSQRYSGGSFSDYETRYTGLSYVETETQYTHYFNVEPDDGLTYNIGTNPFMQYGLVETRDAMAEAILGALQGVCYVPFKVSAARNPAYDLGDVIRFSNGLADTNKVSCITKYTFKFNGGYTMEGVGKNPILASARSKVDKNIAGLLSRVDASTAVSIGFINTEEISIPSISRKTILSIAFATVSGQSKVDIWIEVLFNLTIINSPTPADLRVHYYLNSNEIEYVPRETYNVGGYHILTLHYYFGNLEENTRYEFLAAITLYDASAVIAAGNVHAFLQGFGLAGEGSSWDGTIEAGDVVAPFRISAIPLFGEFTDTVNSVSVHTPLAATAAEYVAEFVFGDAGIIGEFTDSSSAVSDLMVFSPWTNGSMVTTDATVTAGTGWVGSGDVRLDTAAELVTDEVTYADSVDITGSVDSLGTAFLLSPDGGDTWYGWQNGAWVQNYKMSFFELSQLTSAEWQSMDSVALKVFLGSESTIYSLNLYGSNADIEWLYRYIMSTAEGNKVFNPVYVSDDNGFQMITDYDYDSTSQQIDSGYLSMVDITTNIFSAVNTIKVFGYDSFMANLTTPAYSLVDHNCSQMERVSGSSGSYWMHDYWEPIPGTYLAINIEQRTTTVNSAMKQDVSSPKIPGYGVIYKTHEERDVYDVPQICGGVTVALVRIQDENYPIYFRNDYTSNAGQCGAAFYMTDECELENVLFLTPRSNEYNNNVAVYNVTEDSAYLMVCAQFSESSSNNSASIIINNAAVANGCVMSGDYGQVAVAMADCVRGDVIMEQTYNKSGNVGNVFAVWKIV